MTPSERALTGQQILDTCRDLVVQELSKASLWAKAAADRAAKSGADGECMGLLRSAANLDARISQITKGA